MTPADIATQNAISFECKKDSLRQSQSGDWKIAFTVQGLDMDERLTKAFPGTRYMAVLVEVNDDELPVQQPETKPHGPSLSPPAKRMDWRDLQPAAQAGIRCEEPVFKLFLRENYPDHYVISHDPAEAVRSICGVKSRSELGSNHHARVLWHSLDQHFQAWKLIDA